MCVILRCAGLSSSDAWSRGSIGILATSLGFARCFCKPSSIFASQFRNLKAFSMLGGDFAAILKFGDHFAEKWHVHKPFLKHFLELKLCIPYLVSKLGKSGIQRFKRYAIWR